jgi:putative pyruvate formate lyase activating enzyme
MPEKFIPSYKKISKSDFEKRIDNIYENLKQCTCCPNNCKVNRLEGKTSLCFSSDKPIVSSYTLHFGEEPLISGTNGAGNIFFGNCNLKCVYCQNFVISQNPRSEIDNQISVEELSEIMLALQSQKCHNIGLVSPSHFAAPIIHSVYLANEKGLNLPIIYNSNGYDSVNTLKIFKDVIDIYLPDFKYGDSKVAKEYSNVSNYYETAKAAITEMYNQVGSELIIEDGVIKRGLIIRHLILPNGLADTEKIFKFISELDKKICISLMSQYYPTNKAQNYILLNRTISYNEYLKAISLLDKYGLENGWVQEYESNESYRPYFENSRLDPFRNKTQ